MVKKWKNKRIWPNHIRDNKKYYPLISKLLKDSNIIVIKILSDTCNNLQPDAFGASPTNLSYLVYDEWPSIPLKE